MPVIHLLKQHFTLLNALILLGLCASATAQITTITANNLACRANGAQRNPSAWRLDYNGFLGTFISVTGTSPATVGFAVSASKSSNDSGTPL